MHIRDGTQVVVRKVCHSKQSRMPSSISIASLKLMVSFDFWIGFFRQLANRNIQSIPGLPNIAGKELPK